MNIRQRLAKLESVLITLADDTRPSAKETLMQELHDRAERLQPEGLGDLEKRCLADLCAGYRYLELSDDERDTVGLEICRRVDLDPAADPDDIIANAPPMTLLVLAVLMEAEQERL